MAKPLPAPKPMCAVCKVDMEIGLIPDFYDGGTDMSCWQPGSAVEDTGFFRSGPIKIDHATHLKIDAWRCPTCGRLELFAIRSIFEAQVSPSVTATPAEAEKRCPQCAKMISAAAVTCRYCDADVSAAPGSVKPLGALTAAVEAAGYKVVRQGGVWNVQGRDSCIYYFHNEADLRRWADRALSLPPR